LAAVYRLGGPRVSLSVRDLALFPIDPNISLLGISQEDKVYVRGKGNGWLVQDELTNHSDDVMYWSLTRKRFDLGITIHTDASENRNGEAI